MYSATCPTCGATLTTSIAGQVWFTCAACSWYGLLTATPAAPAGITPRVPCPHCNNSFSYAPAIPMAGAAPRWYCSACGYHGPLAPQAAASAASAASAATAQASQAATPQPERTPDQMRDALREDVFALAGDICVALRDVSAADWRLSVAGAYERMQEAHTALYESLGGRHMGDYPPDTFNVSQAVVAMATRLMLALYAAERASEEAKG